MRKYLATLVFGGCALMGSPVWAASSEASSEASTAVVIDAPARVSVPGWRDEASMLLVGTALIGLAAAVRRAA